MQVQLDIPLTTLGFIALRKEFAVGEEIARLAHIVAQLIFANCAVVGLVVPRVIAEPPITDRCRGQESTSYPDSLVGRTDYVQSLWIDRILLASCCHSDFCTGGGLVWLVIAYAYNEGRCGEHMHLY